MLPAMVTLEPMTPAAYERWYRGAIRSYAVEKVRVGTWSEDDAEARSERTYRELLPDGLATAGHHLRSIIADTGDEVGVLWFAAMDELAGTVAFIYDIEVWEAFRGRGYGRDAMRTLEPLARSLGFDSIALHVFGDNEVARSLYRSSGYRETDVTMRKDLG
jgi:ribosomal protein S18 acetylase RimI-like enzyme